MAPFFGAAIAIPMLGDHPRQSDVVGGAIMLAGVLWLLRRTSAATSS